MSLLKFEEYLHKEPTPSKVVDQTIKGFERALDPTNDLLRKILNVAKETRESLTAHHKQTTSFIEEQNRSRGVILQNQDRR